MPVSAMTADQLADVDWEGLINEDVLQTVFDISPESLAFLDLIGSGTADNPYYSWTTDKLEKPDDSLLSWVVDGADVTRNDASTGIRLGNHAGILDKGVEISHMADASDTIGRGLETAYQLNKVMKELMRLEEYALLGNQGSVEGDKATDTAGQPAGFGAMCKKLDNGSGGSGGAFSAGSWSAWTPGTKTPLTETMVRDAAQMAWMEGGNPAYFLSHPNVTRALSEYMFTSSSRIATLTGETGNNGPATAMGSVNVFLSDFGSEIRFVPNRWHPTFQSDGGAAGDATHAYLLDPEYVETARLRGYQSEPLGKKGHANRRMISVITGLRNLSPDASICIPDIDHAAPVTQS